MESRIMTNIDKAQANQWLDCSTKRWEGRKIIPFGVWMAACILATAIAYGQELVTLQSEDGQVIKGELIKQENGSITVKSSIFGEIVVPEAKVKLVKDEPTKNTHGDTVVPSVPPKVDQTDKDAHPSKEETRAWLNLPDGMTIHAGAGLGYLEGHDTDAENYSASLEVNYDTKRYQNQLIGKFQYGKANGALTSDNYLASARTYRYFGHPEINRYFSKLKFMHSADEIQLVDNQSEVLIGLGLDLHQSDWLTVKTSAGYVSEWEDFSANPDYGVTDPGFEHRNKAFLHEEIELKLGSKFSIQHDGYFMIEEHEEHEVRLTTGLKYKLTNHLSLDLNHSYIFDNTSPIGVDEDTTQINLQLGYSL